MPSQTLPGLPGSSSYLHDLHGTYHNHPESLVIHWAAAHESFQLKHPGDEEEPLAIGPWWDGPGFCGPVVLKTYCQTITFLLNCS